MINIRQLTNHDIAAAGASTVPKTFLKGGDKGEYITYDYYVVPTSLLGKSIFKMGYCCEVKAISFPIFLTINNKETMFEIGKTGMFEFQNETWKDINGDNIERTALVEVSEIKVPTGLNFTIDYCYDDTII